MAKPKYITDDGKVLLLIFFEGKVQMVSFRFTCNKIATKLGLSGYVKNTEDNVCEVEALLKGHIDDINECIFQLEDEFKIRNTRAQRITVDNWLQDTAHEVHYRNGRVEVYKPVYLGCKGYNRDNYFEGLSQEDIDFINGYNKAHDNDLTLLD